GAGGLHPFRTALGAAVFAPRAHPVALGNRRPDARCRKRSGSRGLAGGVGSRRRRRPSGRQRSVRLRDRGGRREGHRQDRHHAIGEFMEPAKPQQMPIQIELGDKESEGIYSNMAVITHSAREFIVDFARRMPGTPKAKVYSRIVMTPPSLVMFLKTLEQNVAMYQEKYGRIKVEGVEDNEPRDIGFK